MPQETRPGGRAVVQAIQVPASGWTRASFAAWLKRNGYRADALEEETGDRGTLLLAVQRDASDFARVVFKKSGRGLVFRLGYGERAEPAPAPEPEPQPAASVPWYERDVLDSLFGE